MKNAPCLVTAALAALAVSGCAGLPVGTAVPLAGISGEEIGFDDLGVDASLGKLLVPCGRTGAVYLLDPETGENAPLRAFPSVSGRGQGHDTGVTSADSGMELVFASDRNTRSLKALDPRSGRVEAAVALNGKPDYVRFVDPTHEIWVTEPKSRQIEIFSIVRLGKALSLMRSGAVQVPGGPESLVIDPERGIAFTNSWKETSFEISLSGRRIIARWRNGCAKSRGLALDEADGFLFVGCGEGKATTLDVLHGGKPLSSMGSGRGVDIIAYDPGLRHLYVPGAEDSTLAVASVGRRGNLTPLRMFQTAPGAHCVVAHGRRFWVCDPRRGRLLRFDDR